MKRPDFSHIKTHKIRGKLYRLLWKKPHGNLEPGRPFVGSCESPHDTGRELRISPKQDPKDMLGTVVHEVAHGAFWDLDEPAIEAFERDLMRLLSRMKIKVSFGDE